MIAVDNKFSDAVKAYREAINKSFFQCHGDDIDFKPFLKKIKHLYRKAPTATRASLLYFSLKTMSKRTCNQRLTDHTRHLGLELTEELEKTE